MLAPIVTLLMTGALAMEPAAETLYHSEPFTQAGAFTAGIEGPACDRDGFVYAVNLARQQTIGRVGPDGRGEVFLELPGKSTGNGIRFGSDGTMFIADYAAHNVLRVVPGTKDIRVHAHSDEFNQPNDLAIAADDTLQWQPAATLETDPGEYSYPAIIQTSDGRLHMTYTWKRERIVHVVVDPDQVAN